MAVCTVIISIFSRSPTAAKEAGVEQILVHAITDGRDASPTGGADYLTTCAAQLAQSGARIITVVGRYFAMDRDRRWDRTKLAWDAIVLGRGEVCEDTPSAAVSRHYAAGKTDEFMPALIFAEPNEQRIRDGDTVLFFNFRADRARQLSQAFLFQDFDGFDREVGRGSITSRSRNTMRPTIARSFSDRSRSRTFSTTS